MTASNSYPPRERLSLSQKLVAAFGLLFLALVGTTATAWWTLDRIGEQAGRMAQVYAPQIERINDVQVFMFRISLEARHLMLVDTEAERQETLGRIVQFREAKMALLSEIEANASTAKGREILTRIRAADVAFWRLAQEVAGKAMAGDSAGAFAQLEAELVGARNAMLVPIGEQRDWQQQLMANAIAESDRIAVSVKTALGVAGVLVILLTAWVVWSVLRMMDGAFARAQNVTRQIAAGHLDADVYVRRGDEFGALFASIVNMKQRLNDVVARVRQTSGQVITAASELDHTNEDLRSVSQAQNHAIEATAEHARSISSAIDSSAANADNVSRLAGKAAEIASQGGQAVTQVVQEMQRIGDASRRISEIVSVIDGIAFQTNILALNAAVEAARAGEQGRGFAVVAGEVRSLAQRSTQAAREVKQLIDTSTQRVQSGSGAAENAGQTMQRVVDSVAELSNLMGSIAQATAQQRASAQELDRAVAELNQSASTSAAVVERSHSTAAALRQQAQMLDATMSVFDVHGDAGAAAQRPATLAA